MNSVDYIHRRMIALASLIRSKMHPSVYFEIDTGIDVVVDADIKIIIANQLEEKYNA